MIFRKSLYIFFILIFAITAKAQIGGTSTFQQLNLSSSARIASLGGENISINDNDLNFVYQNPALLNDTMDNNFALNYSNYFSDVNYGYLSYSKNFSKIGNIAFGFFNVNYGDFKKTDETGVILGDFNCKDYVLNVAWSKILANNLTAGIEFKPLFSQYDSYNSFGIAFDLGANYFKNGLSIGVVANNIGIQIKPFVKGNIEPMPFEIQAGISQKLKHAPFRFSLTLHNIQKYDLTYVNPNAENKYSSLIDDTTSTNGNSIGNIADNLMRHVVLGVELMPSKNFFINFGYNYKVRQEMKISTRGSIVGFTWGFGIKISKFRISYSNGIQHLAGHSNYFSITTNLNDFISRK